MEVKIVLIANIQSAQEDYQHRYWISSITVLLNY